MNLHPAWSGRISAWLLLALVAVSCTSRDAAPEAQSPTPSRQELVAQVASYDLAVGKQRFMVGLLTPQQELVGGGSVSMKFVYLGTRERPQSSGPVVSEATGNFLAIPREGGSPPPLPVAGPRVVSSSEGSGVYAADATFDRAGFWGVLVEASVEERGPLPARATFEVLPEHEFPWIGEDAPRSENLTVDSTDAPKSAIDSRAQGATEVPDPELHSTTVAKSLADKRPVLLVVATPVYCVSRFCGPITDMVSELSKSYGNRANFVHIEVWRDFEKKELNRAAADWILTEKPSEPWIFLIGSDGKISARWDNVATRQEVEPALQALPAQ
ncbi:MAG TPA: hypothetical protein VHJ40_08840 [Actinomycetota bacterium]|nr:hypothetical protein [Actinomycetota bacterium]